MADDVRQEKVAEGLKKLRNFQQRSNKKKRTGKSKAQNESKRQDDEESITSQSSLPPQENSEPDSTPPVLEEKIPEAPPPVSSSPIEHALSSKESLLQLQQQINGLISETHSFVNGTDSPSTATSSSHASPNTSSLSESHLQVRNQELAGLLDMAHQTINRLQLQMEEMQRRWSGEQQAWEKEKQSLLEKAAEDQASLNEQLQVHIQTIGILVAEKTELQSTLSLNQQTAKQKASEVEELQTKCQALRLKLAEKERELSSLSQATEQSQKSSKELLSELDKVKTEREKFEKYLEELKQENQEISEKYQRKVTECQRLEQAVAESHSRLQLSELYAQQLASPADLQAQLESLQHEKLALESSLSQIQEKLERSNKERNDLVQTHQAHVVRCSTDIATLQEELRQASLQLAQQSKEIAELQDRLEATHDSPSSCHHKEEIAKLEDDIATLKYEMDQLTQENEDLKAHIAQQEQENGVLSRLVEEQEGEIERRREQTLDQEQLLASIQSDKVAASRAVAQNKQLKAQLEELQTAIVRHNDEKLELTDALSHEKHVVKNLSDKVNQQKEEIIRLQGEMQELQKKVFQNDQMVDKLRHFQVQNIPPEDVLKELATTQERLREVQAQNAELRMALARQAEQSLDSKAREESGSLAREISKKDDLVAALSASVQQLEMERNHLLETMGEQENQRSSLKAQLTELQKHSEDHPDHPGMVSQEEYEALKSSMERLEEKFRKTMNRVAELSDEKQHLEHLVTQLEGETETIGDYIHLYQVQRALMKKRAAEKDEYIAQLAKDREDLKEQLKDLQCLVQKLLKDKKIQAELPESVEVDQKEIEQETTHRIEDLLHQLETKNLLERQSPDNFHPCPVCSGRLLHV